MKEVEDAVTVRDWEFRSIAMLYKDLGASLRTASERLNILPGDLE
jgi:hypothetical protein